MSRVIFAVLASVAFASAVVRGEEAVVSEREQNSHAIVRLLNSRAAGSPRGYEEAARVVRADADAGRPLQQFVLALVALDADAPQAARIGEEQRKRYLEASREKIRLLAEKRDNPLAWYLLSIENNDLGLLKRAADGGNVQALNAWGTITLTRAFRNPAADTNETVAVAAKAFSYFKRASDQGDANGLYNVGVCYLNGYGCERNENLAFKCFLTSSEAGHPEAINNIGGFYRDGVVVRKSAEKSVEWFARSARLGNAFGQLNYALALQRGDGVERDDAAAAELLGLASAQGNAEAMNVYGMCYFHGRGVEKNAPSAFRWFSRSAARGFPPAMENLAVCYDTGNGVKRDEKLATVWKVRARANGGDANAAAWLKQNGYTLR